MILSLAGKNSLIHELRVKTAAKLLFNAIYYYQNPSLKSDFGECQSVKSGKLFPHRTVFELA